MRKSNTMDYDVFAAMTHLNLVLENDFIVVFIRQ